MQRGSILVTGGMGFAGSHLLDLLADRAPLVAWHRPGGKPPDPDRHIEWRGVDLLDPAQVGLPVSVFVQVTLERQVETALQVFEEAVSKHPEVMECYLMTGDADYLLRVVAPDLESYQRFLLDNLTRIPGVASIKSSFALKQVGYRTALPLNHIATGK